MKMERNCNAISHGIQQRLMENYSINVDSSVTLSIAARSVEEAKAIVGNMIDDGTLDYASTEILIAGWEE
jgi:uroporphyrinogen-III decarboxylase